MPMYEYQCDACSIVFEKMEKMENKGTAIYEACPGCGLRGHIKSLMSSPRINKYGVWNSQKKLPDSFKNRMNQMKKEHPNGFKGSQFF